MIDINTPEGKVIAATLRLAGERDWASVSLRDIADAAGITLAELRETFGSKTAILTAYGKLVDTDVLSKMSKPDPEESPRDQLFEAIMARFDAMNPHKDAIASIVESREADPAIVRSIMESQSWMLQAAGIGTDGMKGSIRVAGLTSLYGSVVRTWLTDDDPGMAKTMAVLDRRLRRGEQTMQNVESALSVCERVTGMLRPGNFGFGSRSSSAPRDEFDTGDMPPESGSATGSSA
ncbi:MAG: helix-turn-helix domain-containing protein [Pseudomonadota bacterium]